MSLVVRVQRAKDYKEAIKVKIPWTPPGVGAPTRSHHSLPTKTKIIIPINANSEARMPAAGPSSSPAKPKQKRATSASPAPSSPFTVAEPFLNGSIDLATTEVGKNVTLLCELETLQPFDGQAQLTLGGLPHGVTAQPVSIKANDKSVKIPLKVPADVKPGKSTRTSSPRSSS